MSDSDNPVFPTATRFIVDFVDGMLQDWYDGDYWPLKWQHIGDRVIVDFTDDGETVTSTLTITVTETPFVCTVIIDSSQDIDVAPRCGKPAVGRLAGDLDFPVCREHQELFSPTFGNHTNSGDDWGDDGDDSDGENGDGDGDDRG